MERGTGDRGVSEVMGFILVFGMLVLSFTVYQGLVVPDQNRQVEFQHNQDVQGQFQELRNSLLTSAATGARQSASIKLGADYPQRTIAVNLGISGGALQTTSLAGADTVTIANASGDGAYGEVDDVWNGSTRSFETRTLTYQPTYSFYTGAPVTRLDNSLLYNQFDQANLTVADQAIIDGNHINLVFLAGDVSASGRDTVSVELKASSAATNRISIRNDTTPIAITIPTELSADRWNETLWPEHVDNPDVDDGHVQDVRDSGPGQVEILLEPGVTYDLRLAEVGLGGDVDAAPAEYLALVDRPDETITNGSSHFVTVEARDRFNNPVTGEAVNATIDGDGTFGDGSTATIVNTSADGRATVTYVAPSSPGDVTLRFEIDDGSSDAEIVEVPLDVVSGVGGGGGDGDGGDDDGSSTVNPSAEQKTIVFVNATVRNGGSDQITLWLNNTADTADAIDEARFQFYNINNPSSDNEPPESVEINGVEVPYLGPFTSVGGVTIPQGEHSLTLSFDHVDGGGFTVRGSDFFILTIRTDSDETITYYIGVVE